MFVLGGMALGFVIGASIMKYTMNATMRVRQDLASIEAAMRAALSIPLPDDGGESFHEECGDR
jgi:hypothetical protein